MFFGNGWDPFGRFFNNGFPAHINQVPAFTTVPAFQGFQSFPGFNPSILPDPRFQSPTILQDPSFQTPIIQTFQHPTFRSNDRHHNHHRSSRKHPFFKHDNSQVTKAPNPPYEYQRARMVYGFLIDTELLKDDVKKAYQTKSDERAIMISNAILREAIVRCGLDKHASTPVMVESVSPMTVNHTGTHVETCIPLASNRSYYSMYFVRYKRDRLFRHLYRYMMYDYPSWYCLSKGETMDIP